VTYTKTLGSARIGLPAVIAVNLFPTEAPVWIYGPGRESGQRKDAGATGSRLGCRFDDHGFALAFGLEPGTRGSLDESGGQEEIARFGNFKEHTGSLSGRRRQGKRLA